MKKFQLCFTIGDETHNGIIKEKLRQVKENLVSKYGKEYQVHSCHMNRKIVREKGFSEEMLDFLYELFGTQYINECRANTFDEAVENNFYREAVSSRVDGLIIIGETPVSNIKVELELFTNRRVTVF